MLRHFLYKVHMLSRGAFQVALGAKNSPVNDMRHGFNPWVGKIPWLHGNPLQYSCLEKPMDREPGGIQSIASQRVEHNRGDLACPCFALLYCITSLPCDIPCLFMFSLLLPSRT